MSKTVINSDSSGAGLVEKGLDIVRDLPPDTRNSLVLLFAGALIFYMGMQAERR